MIVYDIESSIGYGPHRDLSHNSKYSRFYFLHQDPCMETRLPQPIPNSLKIYAGITVKSHKIKGEVQTGFICRIKNNHVTYQHENEAC